MRRFLGFVLSAFGVFVLTAPIVTAVGETGCGGCYGKSCPCADGTTQPSTNAPCGCGTACQGHGGVCNSGECTPDAGGADAATDAPVDAPSDVVTSNDGGLGQGSLCDLQKDMCGAGLKCCSEPTHIPDASTHDICVPPEDGGICPAYP